MSKQIIELAFGLTINGTVGSAITLLDRILCIAQATHEASGPTFTDRSAEARLEGGTSYNLLAATTDRFYFGSDAKFPGIRVDLDTVGVGLALVWEYWNGSTWATLTVTDGTSGFTVDGEVTWTKPSDWAKTTVNAGSSLFFVRVRTTTITTTPTAFFTVVNWTIYDGAAATNAKVYRSIGEDGVSTILMHVDDNGPVSANRSHHRLYEAWNAVAHTGTAATPTAAQLTNGVAWQKSNTADATNRTFCAYVSRDKVMLFANYNSANDMASVYIGKFLSYVSGDVYNQVLCGAATLSSSGERYGVTNGVNGITFLVGHYVQRAYPGSGGSAQTTAYGMLTGQSTSSAFFSYPNGPNGGLLIHPKLLVEPINGTASGHLRGELTDLMMIPHTSAAALVTGDTFTDPASGKVYYIVKSEMGNGLGMAPWCGLEVPT